MNHPFEYEILIKLQDVRQKNMTSNALQADYKAHEIHAKAFLAEFLHQLTPLIQKSGVKLGVPVEGRVKEWSSIVDKLDRKALRLGSCKELPDLIGVRATTLFMRDAEVLCQLIENTFPIKAKENKADVLDQGRFGYLSRHFIVTLPDGWKGVPTFAGLDYTVEIQIRTLSQHIWAAASHLLQYKKESDVPREVGRSIHRVAALLETVDLEFERVLQEREHYMRSKKATAASTPLDADNLKLVLDDGLPSSNRSDDEVYSDLLTDLYAFEVSTVEALRELIKDYIKQAIADDKKQLERRRNTQNPIGTTVERMDRGVFYNHVGLTRQLLAEKFRDKWSEYNSAVSLRSLTSIAK